MVHYDWQKYFWTTSGLGTFLWPTKIIYDCLNLPMLTWFRHFTILLKTLSRQLLFCNDFSVKVSREKVCVITFRNPSRPKLIAREKSLKYICVVSLHDHVCAQKYYLSAPRNKFQKSRHQSIKLFQSLPTKNHLIHLIASKYHVPRIRLPTNYML